MKRNKGDENVNENCKQGTYWTAYLCIVEKTGTQKDRIKRHVNTKGAEKRKATGKTIVKNSNANDLMYWGKKLTRIKMKGRRAKEWYQRLERR